MILALASKDISLLSMIFPNSPLAALLNLILLLLSWLQSSFELVTESSKVSYLYKNLSVFFVYVIVVYFSESLSAVLRWHFLLSLSLEVISYYCFFLPIRVSSVYLKLLIFHLPIFTLPSSESSSVFCMLGFLVQIK